MFTGIIEEIGILKQTKRNHNSVSLTISCKKVLEATPEGASIAVNGVCLTVTSLSANTFTADVMHETLKRSNLGKIQHGSMLNLERALPACGRFDGHIVSGHIDGTGKIRQIRKDGIAIVFTVETDSALTRYMVEKGSIAVDGTSLTLIEVGAKQFTFSAIPHSVEHTVLKDRKAGDLVNLECDILGKYVEKMVGKISPGYIKKIGF